MENNAIIDLVFLDHNKVTDESKRVESDILARCSGVQSIKAEKNEQTVVGVTAGLDWAGGLRLVLENAEIILFVSKIIWEVIVHSRKDVISTGSIIIKTASKEKSILANELSKMKPEDLQKLIKEML